MKMKKNMIGIIIGIIVGIALIINFAIKVFGGDTITSHAISMHNDIKYDKGFKYFDYVNPNALKGGTVRLAVVGTFDNLNPFILKGNPASGIGMCYDTLTVQSQDEPFTEYGLLAETITYPLDKTWVEFKLRKEAKWHNGKSVTADDVVFSFNIITKEGHPFYAYYYADILEAKRIDKKTVRFIFKESNPELPLIAGQMPIVSKEFYLINKFNKTSLEPALYNGPYKVIDVKPGKSITYERVVNYWGKDLAVNKGKYNFDIIKYEYYRDETIIVEAFKAGEYDFRMENSSKTWATAYKGDNFDNGKIIKEEVPHNNPTGMQSFAFNTRNKLFQSPKVREALSYMFDFEWTNKTLFYNAYTRTKSYFSNSELASRGLPSKDELKLLEPYRNQLPKEVFTKEYNPPFTNGSGNIRTNMKIALRLLAEAGWTMKNGILVNKNNELFEFEILLVSAGFERIVIPFKKNLERIGIRVDVRLVDPSQYINRLSIYDFDMIIGSWGQSLSPGNEQKNFWSSEAADIGGTRNYVGIKNLVIDILIDEVIYAPNRKALITACRALDRILLWNYYVIPQWHICVYRIAYWNKFEKPSIKPKYGLGFLETWWIK